MTDFPLLDFSDRATVGEILRSTDPQPAELERVTARIRQHVLEFCKQALKRGGQFHSEDLRQYVQAKAPGAPGSSDRILRYLRQKDLVRYEVVSRSKSLYRVTEIPVKEL